MIQSCIDSVRNGEQELRAVAKSVERPNWRQLEAKSVRENLGVVFDEYAANVGRGVYAELVRSRLPAARDAVEGLQNDAELLHKMADELGICRTPSSNATICWWSRKTSAGTGRNCACAMRP